MPKKKHHTQSSIKKDTSITPLPFAKTKTPLPILNKRHKYYTTSICQKQKPHTHSSIKDTSIMSIPFAKKKALHPILNKKT
jgi:hypothetical protein